MHGGNVYSIARKNGVDINQIIDFSSNMNDFINIHNFSIAPEYIKNYPEIGMDSYKRKLADKEFSENNIFPVPGITYFIHRYLSMINGNIIIITPVFTEYLYILNHGKKIFIPFEAIEKDPDIIQNYNFKAIILVYPDSPRGEMLNINSLLRLIGLSYKKNAFVILDESFIWFVEQRHLNEKKIIEEYSNVIIARSMTKVFSMPGLRLGYVASCPENIDKLEAMQEPWAISEVALKYLEGIDYKILESVPSAVAVERKYLIGRMAKLGFSAVGIPEANYATFHIPDHINGITLKTYLENHNLMVRTLEDYPEFGYNYMRINIKRREKNNILINEISKFNGGDK
ncbi:MAG: aminotransferase class I/II-fold pyridoxal phosphate-dependent enzyme [Ferroplasma sp.]